MVSYIASYDGLAENVIYIKKIRIHKIYGIKAEAFVLFRDRLYYITDCRNKIWFFQETHRIHSIKKIIELKRKIFFLINKYCESPQKAYMSGWKIKEMKNWRIEKETKKQIWISYSNKKADKRLLCKYNNFLGKNSCPKICKFSYEMQ